MLQVLKPTEPTVFSKVKLIGSYSKTTRKANLLASLLSIDPLLFIGADVSSRETIAALLSTTGPGADELQRRIARVTADPFITLMSNLDPSRLAGQIIQLLSALESLRRQIHPRTIQEAIGELAATNPGFFLFSLVQMHGKLATPVRLSSVLQLQPVIPHRPIGLFGALQQGKYYMGSEAQIEATDYINVVGGQDPVHANIPAHIANVIRQSATLFTGGSDRTRILGEFTGTLNNEYSQESVMELLLLLAKPSLLRDAISAASGLIDLSTVEDTTSPQTIESYKFGIGGNMVLNYLYQMPYLAEIRDFLDLLYSPIVADCARGLFPNPLENAALMELHTWLKSLKLGMFTSFAYQNGTKDSANVLGSTKEVYSVPNSYLNGLQLNRQVVAELLGDGVVSLLLQWNVLIKSSLHRPDIITAIDRALFKSVNFTSPAPIMMQPNQDADIVMTGSLTASKAIGRMADWVRSFPLSIGQVRELPYGISAFFTNEEDADNRNIVLLSGAMPQILMHEAANRDTDLSERGVLRMSGAWMLIPKAAKELIIISTPFYNKLGRLAPVERCGLSNSKGDQSVWLHNSDDLIAFAGYRSQAAFVASPYSGRVRNADQSLISNHFIVGSHPSSFITGTLLHTKPEIEHFRLLAFDPETYSTFSYGLFPFLAVAWIQDMNLKSVAQTQDFYLRPVADIIAHIPAGDYEGILSDLTL